MHLTRDNQFVMLRVAPGHMLPRRVSVNENGCCHTNQGTRYGMAHMPCQRAQALYCKSWFLKCDQFVCKANGPQVVWQFMWRKQ